MLSSDYVQCLNYLMKYPDTVDITFVIRYALYVKDTKVRLYFVHLTSDALTFVKCELDVIFVFYTEVCGTYNMYKQCNQSKVFYLNN